MTFIGFSGIEKDEKINCCRTIQELLIEQEGQMLSLHL